MSFWLQRFVPNLADVVATGVVPRQRAALVSELLSDHRLTPRQKVLDLLPPGGVGAELGVFSGLFSSLLLRRARPKKVYFVDPWWTLFGETYPDWGPYTDYGRLSTRDAYGRAVSRIQRHAGQSEVEVLVQTSESFLESLQPATLDWAYLDSTHSYEGTCSELAGLSTKMKHGGLILGDDWHADESHHHAGVRRAVLEFVEQPGFELVGSFAALQWAIRRVAG